MKSYSKDSPSITTRMLCSVCPAAPCPVSRSSPPALEKLHGNTPFSSKLKAAISLSSQKENKRRVRGAGRKARKIGMREVRKVEEEEELRRGWYGVFCVQEK